VGRNWGELHVTFVDEHQEIGYLPAAWTSAAPPDPFVLIAAGRARFRTADLLRLVTLLRAVQEALPQDDVGAGAGIVTLRVMEGLPQGGAGAVEVLR
jgi:hypothetical protein